MRQIIFLTRRWSKWTDVQFKLSKNMRGSNLNDSPIGNPIVASRPPYKNKKFIELAISFLIHTLYKLYTYVNISNKERKDVE